MDQSGKKIFEEWEDALLPGFKTPGVLQKNTTLWQRTWFLTFAAGLFFVLFLRLFHLQITQGEKNRQLAEGNRIAIKVIHAPRGVIFDRNGRVLAANSPAFRLVDPKSKKAVLLSREQALKMEVSEDPNFSNLEIDSKRHYPLGEMAAHSVGYVGEISENQLKDVKFSGYKIGDRVGQLGEEAYYENILRGVDGGEVIEVDNLGRIIRTLRAVAPIPGKSITLTLDADIQKILFDELSAAIKKSGSCCGAAMAMDPKSGQVLALTSLPSFDGNVLTSQADEREIEQILQGKDAPLLNRAIAGQYPPGSTFKIVSALAALSSGKITPQTQIEDTGEIFLGSFRFTNWYFTQYGRLEGSVDIKKALKRSNDTYFYRVGQTIGEKMLSEWARKLHLGGKLKIDLPQEDMGLVPDETWKKKEKGEVWFPGDTLHLSIGQGFILTTPLQILGITSFIAADGKLFRPQLLLKITDENGNIQKAFKSEILAENIASSEHIKVIKEGLEQVASAGGTAWPFFTFPIKTAGKTGTSEYGDPKGRTHAWYTSFAPSDDPKIAMTVLIEGGGEGSSVASPIVKEVFRWFFSEEKSKLIQDTYQTATDSARTLGE